LVQPGSLRRGSSAVVVCNFASLTNLPDQLFIYMQKELELDNFNAPKEVATGTTECFNSSP
jgi:hypothetical protein